MSHSSARVFVFSLILALGGFHAGAMYAKSHRLDPTNPKLILHVLLYNYAPVSAERLAKAENTANFIFRQVGVGMVWVENTALDQGNGAPTLEEMDIILRILPQPRAVLPSRTALGEALPCGLGREGCIASVFFDRVKELSVRTKLSIYQVLGHAMAHELGHLLLGSNSHSRRGLMCAKWGRRDMERAAQGELLFAKEQSESLLQKVRVRIQNRTSLQASRPAFPK